MSFASRSPSAPLRASSCSQRYSSATEIIRRFIEPSAEECVTMDSTERGNLLLDFAKYSHEEPPPSTLFTDCVRTLSFSVGRVLIPLFLDSAEYKTIQTFRASKSQNRSKNAALDTLVSVDLHTDISLPSLMQHSGVKTLFEAHLDQTQDSVGLSTLKFLTVLASLKAVSGADARAMAEDVMRRFLRESAGVNRQPIAEETLFELETRLTQPNLQFAQTFVSAGLESAAYERLSAAFDSWAAQPQIVKEFVLDRYQQLSTPRLLASATAAVLQDQPGGIRNLFLEFLRLEKREALLTFLDAFTEFQAIQSQQEVIASAREVYQQYFHVEAKHRLELEEKTAHRLQVQFVSNQLHCNMFDVAHSEVLVLIGESVYRCLKSQEPDVRQSVVHKSPSRRKNLLSMFGFGKTKKHVDNQHSENRAYASAHQKLPRRASLFKATSENPSTPKPIKRRASAFARQSDPEILAPKVNNPLRRMFIRASPSKNLNS